MLWYEMPDIKKVTGHNQSTTLANVPNKQSLMRLEQKTWIRTSNEALTLGTLNPVNQKAASELVQQDI